MFSWPSNHFFYYICTMAAPIGNKFWELRSKHGRDRLFATPELMWKAATEYFDWTLENPLIQVDFKGKDAEMVEIPHVMPFTMIGLCLYLDCSLSYFNDFDASLIGKKDELSKGFSVVIRAIRDTVYKQKFDGASCGFYNANIIARDLGLSENVNSVVTSDSKVVVITSETAKALEDLKKKFDDE